MEEKQRQIICGILRAKQQQLLNVVLPQGTNLFPSYPMQSHGDLGLPLLRKYRELH